MELLSPAGNYDKLKAAFAYGADAAYMGMQNFSLRTRADNFDLSEINKIIELKKKYNTKIYCALNIFFHEDELDMLKEKIDAIKAFPFDAFIVSDLGTIDILQKYFPDRELHLSTQANCLNGNSVKIYKKLGFKRIILGRETPLTDIRRIKDACPEMEIEAFVHGAMCMAYSGRCFLSSHLTGRSANQGDCAHTCRWNYRLALQESERPDLYYPILQEDKGLTILSSKDLCMIDHLKDLKDAGVDSLKIEGRMKSIYYVATITRAYRKAIEALDDSSVDMSFYRKELDNVSHREFSTGFFYGHGPIDVPSKAGYERTYQFLGILKEEIKPNIWSLDIKNQISVGKTIEYMGPDIKMIPDNNFKVLDKDFKEVEHIDHCQTSYIQTSIPVKSGWIIRSKII